jgi:hypothetical protein
MGDIKVIIGLLSVPIIGGLLVLHYALPVIHQMLERLP